MTNAIIEARDIHAWYGSSHILHGIDFSLRNGETVGLLGRNGMGKSTLIRSLLGHVRQRAGRIHVRQQDMSRARPHQVAQLGIAYVPEGRGIFPNLSVRENLMMCARAPRDGQQGWHFDLIMDTFPRLAERLENMGDQLSGGEQQMLSIGRALMTNPAAIILDEATEGLAPLIVEEIWRVIGLIRGTGLATLVVDRNFRKVMDQADRLVVLEKGRVVLDDDAAHLRRDPAMIHRYLGV